MAVFQIARLVVGALLLSFIGCAYAADQTSLASHYFGSIRAPCITLEKCEAFTDLVQHATAEHACQNIYKRCEFGEQVLRSLFGATYRQSLPDFIVYIDDTVTLLEGKKDGQKSYVLVQHTPLLMWEGKNTPHLMGAGALRVLVLAHHKLETKVRVTSDKQYEPNPMVAILKVTKDSEIASAEGAPSETTVGEFTWQPLNGNEETVDQLQSGKRLVTWVGMARIPINENSINRVTVTYGPQPASTESGATEKDAAAAVKGAAAALKEAAGAVKDAADAVKEAAKGGKPAEKPALKPDKYSGDFLAATGHFSNSPDSRTAISFALGFTFNSGTTSIATGGSNINLGGFLFAKYYFLRPYLYASPRYLRYRPSIGLVLGTNVSGTMFHNIVYGISVGHLAGSAGVILGVNSITGVAGSTQGRQSRPFLGLEYTF